MKLVRLTFLLCALAILLLLKPHYSSPTQGLSKKIVIKTGSRKLMMITSSEHANVMTSTFHGGSNEQPRDTFSGNSKEEEKKLSEEEEKNALSKYLSMDYPRFKRRRPVHNK